LGKWIELLQKPYHRTHRVDDQLNFIQKSKRSLLDESSVWLSKPIRAEFEKSSPDLDVPAVFALANAAQIPLPRVNILRNDRQKSTEQTLEWLRNRDYRNVEFEDPTHLALAILASIPIPLGRISPAKKKKHYRRL
jgi:hypothetical protein